MITYRYSKISLYEQASRGSRTCVRRTSLQRRPPSLRAKHFERPSVCIRSHCALCSLLIQALPVFVCTKITTLKFCLFNHNPWYNAIIGGYRPVCIGLDLLIQQKCSRQHQQKRCGSHFDGHSMTRYNWDPSRSFCSGFCFGLETDFHCAAVEGLDRAEIIYKVHSRVCLHKTQQADL